MKKSIAAVLLAALMPASALAWGTNGHRMISRVAAENLPASVPAFLRTGAAMREIEVLAAEEDRLKDAGPSWDDDNDPGHFLDVDDNFEIDGVVKLSALPKDMSVYTKALYSVHKDPYKEGFLPYSIIDGFERIRKDFAIWRVDDYMATHAATPEMQQRFVQDRALREDLTLRDIGDWSHFVGDGSQPLHVTSRFNGWGGGPNPNGYTQSQHMHAKFESVFVDAHVKIPDVRKQYVKPVAIVPESSYSQEQIAALVGKYLIGTARNVPKVYQIEKDGGFDGATQGAVAFTATQLARGSEMIDKLVSLAWEDSLNQKVGYPEIPVRDILSGKVVPRQAEE